MTAQDSKETIEWLEAFRETYNNTLTVDEYKESMNKAVDMAEDSVKSVALIATGASQDLSKYCNVLNDVMDFIKNSQWSTKEELLDLIDSYVAPKAFAKYVKEG